MPAGNGSRLPKLARWALFQFLAVALLFVFLEGISSILFVANRAYRSRGVGERVHTEYDSEIGWVNTPSLYVPDLYGPGISMRTNARGFRNRSEIGAGVPEGDVRIVCSGDSFTLGYGVSNEETWVHRLGELGENLETVNMGQGGYGIDQSFLWYRRDGSVLDHDIHLFAFMTWNFKRMQSDDYQGYGKPVLSIEDGKLVTKNVPVPRRAFAVPRLTRYVRELAQLRSLTLLRRLLPGSRRGIDPGSDEEAREVSRRIFEELEKINREKISVLVLVHLPSRGAYTGSHSEPWRDFLRESALERGWFLVDLFEELRAVPPQEVGRLFIPGDGHYSVEGNAWVARHLHAKLRAIPEVAARLDR